MVPLQCLVCDHVNPAGAKFCNDCGSPLHVKQCSRCETVNDQAAKNCSKCGTEFPVPSPRSEAPPISSAQAVAPASSAIDEGLPFRLDFHLNGFPKPAPSAANVTAAAPAPVASEAATATVSSPALQLARPAATIELDQLDPTREPQSQGTAVTSLSSAAQRVAAKVRLHNREAATELRPMSRVMRAVSLATIAFVAIGIIAYYVYGPSVPLNERQGAQEVTAAPVDVNAGGPPTRPIAKIGETPSSPPSVSLGTGSVAAIPAPPVERSTALTIAPVGQRTVAPTGSNGAAGQTPSTNAPPRGVSTGVPVSPSEELPAKADDVGKKPSAATTTAGNPRDRTMPATGSEVTAKPSTPNRPAHTYSAATASESVQPPPRDGRATVPPDVPPRGPCTEGVAALGLCSPNSGGENK